MCSSAATSVRPARTRSSGSSRLGLAILLMAFTQAAPSRAAGLPEPDLVLYGRVVDVAGGGAGVRLTAGALTWTFQPAGATPPRVFTAPLTNINGQFSYVLRIPCETLFAGGINSAGTLALGATYDRSLVTVDGQAAVFVQPAQQLLTLPATDRGRIERVDLDVFIGGTQTLPDNWQLQYFGHTGVDAYADADGDGLNNLAEYLSGTNPVDPGSVFAVEVAESSDGVATVSWVGSAGFIHSVQRSRDLPTGFEDIATDLPATPPLNSYRDTERLDQGPFFYRLTVRPATP